MDPINPAFKAIEKLTINESIETRARFAASGQIREICNGYKSEKYTGGRRRR